MTVDIELVRLIATEHSLSLGVAAQIVDRVQA